MRIAFSIIPCIKNVEILACTFNDLVQREKLGEVLGFTFVCHAFFNVTSLSLNFFETQDNFSLGKSLESWLEHVIVSFMLYGGFFHLAQTMSGKVFSGSEIFTTTEIAGFFLVFE